MNAPEPLTPRQLDWIRIQAATRYDSEFWACLPHIRWVIDRLIGHIEWLERGENGCNDTLRGDGTG
jgi:hypothetical protein